MTHTNQVRITAAELSIRSQDGSRLAGPSHAGITALILALYVTAFTGCHSLESHRDPVPASRLPCQLRTKAKGCQMPFPLTSLGQDKPAAHTIGPGDKLGVYVYGVIPSSKDESPLIQRTQPVNQRYYPPNGSVAGATIGLPMEVDPDGMLDLPIIGRVDFSGMTLTQASDKMKGLYREKKILKSGSERAQISLITPRVRRIVVIREDTPAPNVTMLPAGQVDHIHRGSAEVIDLPIYENDILHALAATGGLPGTDAAREIWVFKRKGLTNPHAICPAELRVHTVGYHEQSGCEDECGKQVINVPLVGCPGEGTPYTQSNVILEEGDVVFLPRREEYFYTGGLIGGAKIPLPRDQDVDVIEAISLAQGSIGGPLGKSGFALATGSPGHMVRPSRVTIVRKLSDGRQFSIQVDLKRAMMDPKERVLIQADDLVMLEFKKHEAITNAVMNWVNLNGNATTTF